MNQNFSQKTNVIKEEINLWKNNIFNLLTDSINKTEELFIVNNNWFNQYEKYLSNLDEKELELSKFDENTDFMNNKLIDSFPSLEDPIENIPKIFILNKSIWNYIYNKIKKLSSIMTIGYCSNNLIILKVCDRIHCFFFLDKLSQIRQGYLEIMKMEKENDVLIDFQNKGIFKFINKDINDINNDFLLIEDNIYKLYITENFEKEEKIKNIFREQFKLLRANSRKRAKEKFKPSDSIIKIKEEMKKSKLMPKVITAFKMINALRKKNKKEKEIGNNNYKLRGKREKQKRYNLNKENLNLEDFFPKTSDKKVSFPGLIGLNNIGATCYMNATLQCFSNTPKLRSYLLDKETYQDLENNKAKNKKLSFALAEVLKNLWEVLSQRYYSPTNFKNIISEMNPLFKGIAANDPKDLVLFLLQTMHKELNKPQNIVVNNNNFINSTNFADVFSDFVQYDTTKNRSIISEEFNGYINSMSMCAVCGTIIHNIQSYNILFFPLEEVRKFMNYNNNNNVMIKDCFQYNEKLDSYPSFYCNNCKNLCVNYNMSKLIYGPQTLIINLNRGRGLEYNVNITLEEYLDLREYIFATESPYYYELIGVICHLGSNDEGGHFIAYCKNSNNCEWYKFNDQIVNKCTFDEVTKTGLPYVLFYNYIQI